MAVATQVLNIARAQLGTREGANNDNPYGKWYGWNNVSWCMIFMSWVFAMSNALDLIGGKFAYCPYAVDWFRKNGRWGSQPQTGALVFYDWDGDGVADHVGIVESFDANSITAIEGNTADPHSPDRPDGVFRRTRARGSEILGYGYPAYGQPSKPPVPMPRPSGGQNVVPLVIDGQWGPKTTQALQTMLKAAVDGSMGIDGIPTLAQLQANPKAGPQTVRGTQTWTGVVPAHRDGVWGPETCRHLQSKVGTAPDGAFGPISTRALQRTLNRLL